MLFKETCGIKRKNAVLIFSIIIVFLCQVHFVVKSHFSLIQVDPCKKTVRRYKAPEQLRGSTAVCVRGNYAYFGHSYHAKEEVYSWDIGNGTLEKIGRLHGCLLYTSDAADE